MLFKIKTKIRRSINGLLKTCRPSSYPYISGDSFRALAQHIFDEHFDFNPLNVQEKDIVFVRGDFLNEFFLKVHPKINNPYILISHNDDTNITEDYKKNVDNKIIHWYAKNLLFNHPKITPIPIGIENLYLNNLGKLSYFNNKEIEKEKNISIKYGFTLKNNKERLVAQKILEKTAWQKK